MEPEEIEVSVDDTIRTLLRRYGVNEDLFIENEEEKQLVLMALREPDIESVKIDEEGALCIMYSGDQWSNNEQRTI